MSFRVFRGQQQWRFNRATSALLTRRAFFVLTTSLMSRAFVLTAIAILGQSAFVFASNPSPQATLLTHVKPLPTALNPDFKFRKTELFLMTETPPQTKQTARNPSARRARLRPSSRDRFPGRGCVRRRKPPCPDWWVICHEHRLPLPPAHAAARALFIRVSA